MNDLTRFFLAVIGLALGLVAFGSSFLTASFPSSLLVSLPCAITGFAVSASTLVMQRPRRRKHQHGQGWHHHLHPSLGGGVSVGSGHPAARTSP